MFSNCAFQRQVSNLWYTVHPSRFNLHREIDIFVLCCRFDVFSVMQVKEVSHDSKMAKLIRSDVNWITEPR